MRSALRRQIPLISVVTAAAWFVDGPAQASAPDGVVVAPPNITGEAPEHVTEALMESVRAGLGKAGVAEAPRPEGCADATCSATEVSEGRARAVAITTVEITGSDYQLSIDLQDASGASLASRSSSCEICTYEESASMLEGMAAEAAGELGPGAAAPEEAVATTGTVTIDSNPSGATVSVDGVVVGTTPYTGEMDQGAHSIQLEMQGRATQQRDIEVAAGATATESFDLPRDGMFSPKTTQIIGWSAVGVGAAAIVGGIVLLVLDNNDVKSDCSGGSVDADGDCRYRYNTLAGGIAMTAAGVVGVGAGAALLVISRKKAKKQPADVALTLGGIKARF